MIKIDVPDAISLQTIAESGQCFRWQRLDEEIYEVIAFGRRLVLAAEEDGLVLRADCGEEEFRKIWYDYLDLGTDYREIRGRIDPADDFLSEAGRAGVGLRILRQEPWEALASFIISQRKTIPAIRSCVEALAERAGDPIEGTDRRSFPGTQAVRRLPDCDLADCGLGYRVRYMRDTAARLAEEPDFFDRLAGLSDDACLRELESLPGVGIKVANCAALFGLHRTDLFPVDVWIARILEKHYPDGFPMDRYHPYNGVMQQYLFCMRKEQ